MPSFALIYNMKYQTTTGGVAYIYGCTDPGVCSVANAPTAATVNGLVSLIMPSSGIVMLDPAGLTCCTTNNCNTLVVPTTTTTANSTLG
jgi:hypothetical protein